MRRKLSLDIATVEAERARFRSPGLGQRSGSAYAANRFRTLIKVNKSIQFSVAALKRVSIRAASNCGFATLPVSPASISSYAEERTQRRSADEQPPGDRSRRSLHYWVLEGDAAGS